MTRRIKYRFGKNEFTSQAGVSKHAATIRKKYGVGGTVTDADDIAFLSDLIRSHTEQETKIGCGVARFYIDSAPQHLGECFWLERHDHTTTDWGVPACLIGVGRLNRQSLRMAIKPQLDAYKSQAIQPNATVFKSEYSGKEFPTVEAVVDHKITFEEIVQGFFKSKGIDLQSELLTRSVDQTSEPIWRDPILLEEFLEYHAEFPLRVVHKQENLSDIKIACEIAER